MGVEITSLPGVWSVGVLAILVVIVAIVIGVLVSVYTEEVALGFVAVLVSGIGFGVAAAFFHGWQENRVSDTEQNNVNILAEHCDVRFTSVFDWNTEIAPAPPGEVESFSVHFLPMDNLDGEGEHGVVRIVDNKAVLLEYEGKSDSRQEDFRLVEYSG